MAATAYFGAGPSVADELTHHLGEIAARDGETIPASGGCQYQYEVGRALARMEPAPGATPTSESGRP